MLAYADPARVPGLADPAPWRPPGTRTAGLIRAGMARLLRGVGLPALVAAIPPEFRRGDPARIPSRRRPQYQPATAGHRQSRVARPIRPFHIAHAAPL